ncbi:MAG: hypothetical protein J6N49_02460 [Alphaproteobacteria bacterium]|nr:hypothetical protein [Alphaproteobacteria bacterium]
MDWRKYIDFIKQDIKRSYAATKGLEIERTYMLRIYIVFALNVIGIIGFAVMKEKFPVAVFVGLWVISALIIGNILWHVFAKDIKQNLPAVFADECQKYGAARHDFKCRIVYIGKMLFRGFSCRIYVYENAVLLKFGKRCMVTDSGRQIKIAEMMFGYRCEFEKDGQYVQCRLNKKQAEILQQWQGENSSF